MGDKVKHKSGHKQHGTKNPGKLQKKVKPLPQDWIRRHNHNDEKRERREGTGDPRVFGGSLNRPPLTADELATFEVKSDGITTTTQSETQQSISSVLGKIREKVMKLKRDSDAKLNEARRNRRPWEDQPVGEIEQWVKAQELREIDVKLLMNPAFLMTEGGLEKIPLFAGKSPEEQLKIAERILGSLRGGEQLSPEATEKRREILDNSAKMREFLANFAEFRGTDVIEEGRELGLNREFVKALGRPGAGDVSFEAIRPFLPEKGLSNNLRFLRDNYEKTGRSRSEMKTFFGYAEQLNRDLCSLAELVGRDVYNVGAEFALSKEMVDAFARISEDTPGRKIIELLQPVLGADLSKRTEWIYQTYLNGISYRLGRERERVLKNESMELVRTLCKMCNGDEAFMHDFLGLETALQNMFGFMPGDRSGVANQVLRFNQEGDNAFNDKLALVGPTYFLMYMNTSAKVETVRMMNNALSGFRGKYGDLVGNEYVKPGCLEEFGFKKTERVFNW